MQLRKADARKNTIEAKDEHGLTRRVPLILPPLDAIERMIYPPELLENAIKWMELTDSNIPPSLEELLNADLKWLESVYTYKWIRDFKMYYHLRPSGMS